MPTEKPKGSEAVCRAIIDTTARLVADRGVAGVSFRDISETANVNHGLITRHFGNKKNLISKTAEYLVRLLFQGPMSRNDSVITFWINNAGAPSWELRALIRMALEDSDRVLLEDNRTVIDEIMKWVKIQQTKENIDSELDPMILMFLFVSMLVGNELFGPYLKDLFTLGEQDFRAAQPKMVEMLMKGLRPE